MQLRRNLDILILLHKITIYNVSLHKKKIYRFIFKVGENIEITKWEMIIPWPITVAYLVRTQESNCNNRDLEK